MNPCDPSIERGARVPVHAVEPMSPLKGAPGEIMALPVLKASRFASVFSRDQA